jgi:bacterioferritin-associated ferredoxin
VYICICRNVNEKAVAEAVAMGANCLRHLHERLGIASQCGTCARAAKDCLDQQLRTQRDTDREAA